MSSDDGNAAFIMLSEDSLGRHRHFTEGFESHQWCNG